MSEKKVHLGKYLGIREIKLQEDGESYIMLSYMHCILHLIIRNLKLRRLRWAKHVACMEKIRNAYRILVGKPEGNRPIGRPRHRWKDNVKMALG